MDRGTDARVADAEPPFEQRLRAAGAEQRGVHRGGDDPPDAEAAGEGSMNLTKQALTPTKSRLASPAHDPRASAPSSRGYAATVRARGRRARPEGHRPSQRWPRCAPPLVRLCRSL